MIENENLLALPERVETSDFASAFVWQLNASGQYVSASTGAAFGSRAFGSVVVDSQVNLAGVSISQ